MGTITVLTYSTLYNFFRQKYIYSSVLQGKLHKTGYLRFGGKYGLLVRLAEAGADQLHNLVLLVQLRQRLFACLANTLRVKKKATMFNKVSKKKEFRYVERYWRLICFNVECCWFNSDSLCLVAWARHEI